MASIAIPGTVRLVDVNNTLNVAHGEGQQDIILVPQPTADPNDPLNWTRPRKLLNSSWQFIWCFFIAALISGLSPAYLLIEADTGISVADLSTGNGLMFLFLGWGTLISQTLAINFGRRPCLIVSMLGGSLITIWSAHVSSVGEWYANRILLGLFCSPQEALVELCIADIHFTHNRGFQMGIYNWTLWCGAYLCPIAGGFVAESLGWRWIQYILAIICICVATGTFFFFEETMFFRQYDTPDGENTTIATSEANSEKASGSHSSDQIATEFYRSPETSGISNAKTYREKLKMWGLRSPKQPLTLVQSVILPFRLLKYPTVIFSGLLIGSILSWYNVLNGTLAEVLGNEPYSFSADMIGLTYFASVIGVSIGCYFSGWISDVLAVRLARKHDGVKEPEHRLWIGAIPLIAHPLGCILYGVGAVHNVHWIGVVIGIAFMCICLPMGSGLAITYIIDCYTELAGESIVTIILVRNTMGKFSNCSTGPVGYG